MSKELKILGYKYEVTRELDYDSMGSAFGRLFTTKQLIHIASDLCDEQVVSTTLHEILEAINFHMGLGLDDAAINPLEAGLYTVLTENGVDLSPLKK